MFVLLKCVNTFVHDYRLGVKNIYRQITEIDAQLISRAGFLKERMRKIELGLKIANIR